MHKYSNLVTFEVEPIADFFALISSATRAANGLWRDGYRYVKPESFCLICYQPTEFPVTDLFASYDPVKSIELMRALDAINGRYGQDSIRPGGLAKRSGGWAVRRRNLSPCYTTRIEDILSIST